MFDWGFTKINVMCVKEARPVLTMLLLKSH